MKKNQDHQRFERTLKQLLSVSHGEIRAKLDAEKAAKKRKPKIMT